MSGSMHHDDDDIQVLRVPRQIARLMDTLFAERGQLTLVADDGTERKTNLLEADSDRGILVVDAFKDEDAPRFEQARELHVKTVIEGIQTWFTGRPPERLHDRGDHYYHLAYPKELYRLQRRAAFRVKVPSSMGGVAQMQERQQARTLRGLLHDISVTGVCFRFDKEDRGLFWRGKVFEQAHVLCDCGLDFHASVAVSNVREEGDKAILVGMRFTELTPAAQRMLELAVQTLQRELLALT